MEKTLFENLIVRLLGNITRTNDYAAEKDLRRNHVNYGAASAYADILRELGHRVDIAVYEEEGYLKVPAYSIDGKKTKLI